MGISTCRSIGTAVLRPAHLVFCTSVLVSACSGASSFPGPSWNLTGGKDAAQLPPKTPAVALTPQPPLSSYRGGRDPVTGRAPSFGGSSQAFSLPPAQPPSPGTAPTLPAASRPPAQVLNVRAAQVEVRPGQSLATIAADQRVSIASLMAANKLRDPYVIPGQVLTIPRP